MANPFTINTGFGEYVLKPLGRISEEAQREREMMRNNALLLGAEGRRERRDLQREERLLGQRIEAEERRRTNMIADEQRRSEIRMAELEQKSELRRMEQEEKRQREMEQKQKEREARDKKNAEISDLVESGSVEDIAKFMATNPEYAKQIDRAVSYKNKQTQRNLVDSSLDILRGKDPKEVIKARAAVVASAGGDPSDTLDAANQTPEELKANAKLAISRYGTEQDQKLADELLGVKSKEDLQKEKLQTEIELQNKEISDIGSGNSILKNAKEGEKKAASFADRMSVSGVELSKLENEIDPRSRVIPLISSGGTGSEAANRLASPEEQLYASAASDFVTAQLRKESGAVIGDDEFERKYREFFPVPGDSDKQIEAKRSRRERAIKSMIAESGGVYDALYGVPDEDEDVIMWDDL